MYNRSFVLEEDHYYPFGLNISVTNPLPAYRNSIKFVSKELQHDEFVNAAGNKSGIELYDFGARMQDPQIGRWNGIDPMASNFASHSPYAYCLNNPIAFLDPDGKYPIYVVTRSFALYKTFGPSYNWYGDNRTFTTSRTASYRSSVEIEYETETRRVTQAKGGASRSHTVDGRKDATSRTSVRQDSYQENVIDVHSAGKNEAQRGSSDIDQFTQLRVTTSGDIKSNHVLNITGTISGDDFPNQEAIVYDKNGNALWLGNYTTSGSREWAPVFSLPKSNEGDVQIRVNVHVKVDKDGVFQGVIKYENEKETVISIEEWNKQFIK